MNAVITYRALTTALHALAVMHAVITNRYPTTALPALTLMQVFMNTGARLLCTLDGVCVLVYV